MARGYAVKLKDKDTLRKKLDPLRFRMRNYKTEVIAMLKREEPRISEWMQAWAKWTDRTPAERALVPEMQGVTISAREGLWAEVTAIGAKGDEGRIVIYAGYDKQTYYAKWLENPNRSYGILLDTRDFWVRELTPKIGRVIEDVKANRAANRKQNTVNYRSEEAVKSRYAEEVEVNRVRRLKIRLGSDDEAKDRLAELDRLQRIAFGDED